MSSLFVRLTIELDAATEDFGRAAGKLEWSRLPFDRRDRAGRACGGLTGSGYLMLCGTLLRSAVFGSGDFWAGAPSGLLFGAALGDGDQAIRKLTLKEAVADLRALLGGVDDGAQA